MNRIRLDFIWRLNTTVADLNQWGMELMLLVDTM